MDGQGERALRLLTKMKAGMGLPAPDLFTFNTALNCCAKSGLGRQGYGLLVEIRSAGLIPNIVTYLAALECCASSREVDDLATEATQLLEEIENCGLRIGPDGCGAIMSWSAKMGLGEKGLRFLDELRARGLRLDSGIYSASIACCAKGGDPERGIRLLDEMRDHGLRPDEGSYIAAMSCCAKLASKREGGRPWYY